MAAWNRTFPFNLNYWAVFRWSLLDIEENTWDQPEGDGINSRRGRMVEWVGACAHVPRT